MMLARWRSFCNPAIAVMLVYADPDKGNGAPVTADSRFDGTFRRCFNDPAAAALFRLGDARIRDDASPQPRCRPDPLEAMENVLWYISRIWTNRPAQLLLYCTFLVHYALALYALWQRRTLRLRASELSQVVLGFAIPFLLVRHVVATRISDSFLHTDVGYYAYLLWVYFVR